VGSYKNISVKLSILITIFIVISLSGCLSEWHGDSAKIVISLGGAGRAAYSSTDTAILNQLEHEIVFTNANTGEKLEFKASGVTFETYITSGSWNITVKSKLNGEYYAIGSKDVVLKLGQNSVKIEMYEALFVTFNTGDGSFKDGKKEVVKMVPKYGKVEQPSPPIHDTFFFVEWYYKDVENDDREIKFIFEEYEITKNITLYAKWSTIPPLTGTVSIDGTAEVGQTLTADTSKLGGTGTINYQWKSKSTEEDIYENIEGEISESYKLTDADLGKHIIVEVSRSENSGSIPSAPIGPVIKQGTPATFTITFDANGGTENPPSPIMGNTTDKIKLPDAGTLHKIGWIFGGWNTQPNGSGIDYDTDSFYTFTDDITLYAKWYVFFNRIDEFSTWLSIQGNNTKEWPYHVKMNVSALGTGGSGSGDAKSSLGLVLQICNEGENKKFVNLDLSGSTFTNIVDRAFLSCIGLTGIIIPNTVESIGQSAFGFCTNLTSVTIPNGVRVIGDGAFSPCPSLTSITIPKSVTSIGDMAFYACTDLTVINVDEGNSAYLSQDGVLYNKTKTILIQYPARKISNTFTIPDSVTSIGSGAFTGCTSFVSITIPNNITSIGGNAFSNCTRLASVTLPNNLNFKIIQNDTFYYCTSLTSVTIPNSVTSIGTHAFYDCTSLASITIPNSITSIGNTAFGGCTSLTSVTFATGSSIMGPDFDKNAFPEGANGNGGDNLRDAYQSLTVGGAGTYTREPNGETWKNLGTLATLWTSVADSKFGSDITISAITYGGGKFVAGGTNGKMAYSSNGINWTAVTDSILGERQINGITYGDGKFVAVCNDGTIAWSSDGVSWTPVPNPFEAESIFGIAYGGDGKFVAGGTNGKMAYSSNGGVTWTAVPNPFEAKSIRGIAYGDGKFVAVGDNGKMAYSTNGTDWTAVTDSQFDYYNIYGIAYGGGKFVAVGVYPEDMISKIAYSTNGTNWTAVPDNDFFDTNIIAAIAYGGGKFVAGGGITESEIKGRMAYSTNGTNWTAVPDNDFFDTNFIAAIAYGGGKFVAVGAFGKIGWSE